MSNTFKEWITSEISLTYSPELPPPVCETWIQYWNKDLHTKKYIVDKIQYDCVLFHLPVQLTSYTQNRIISLQCNLPKYSLLREISCFMHIIKKQVCYMQISFSISSECASLMQITAAICLVQYNEANSTKKCQKWWLKIKNILYRSSIWYVFVHVRSPGQS